MRSITTWTFDAEDPLLLASRFSDQEGCALLYSGGHLDSAKNSFLCLFPEEKKTFRTHENVWEEVKESLGDFLGPALIPLWVGYFGYEMGAFADKEKRIFSLQPPTPDALFYRPSVVIHFEHATQKATLYAKEKLSLERSFTSREKSSIKSVYPSDTVESYAKKIAQIKEQILDGEIYQVNLSQKFEIQGKLNAFEIFKKVAHLNPSPFAAFVNCGNFSIVSSSPERFLKKENRSLETRPIKGTMPRGKTPEEDQKNQRALLTSEKERAELLMITDLMRNDLGKVSCAGSVKTRALWHSEAYENVFHMLSIIESKCKDVHPVDVVRALFPGGSITGCPKLSAMETIARLEKRARGIYTGSIGYFARNGDFDFNIAIRTLVVHPEHAEVQLGGAIVIDSDPIKEYEETLHKGKSLFKILGVEAFVF